MLSRAGDPWKKNRDWNKSSETQSDRGHLV
jgi:hypothetical protein